MEFTTYAGEINIAQENYVYCRINSDNKLDAIKANATSVDYDPSNLYSDITARSSFNSYLCSGTHLFDGFGFY